MARACAGPPVVRLRAGPGGQVPPVRWGRIRCCRVAGPGGAGAVGATRRGRVAAGDRGAASARGGLPSGRGPVRPDRHSALTAGKSRFCGLSGDCPPLVRGAPARGNGTSLSGLSGWRLPPGRGEGAEGVRIRGPAVSCAVAAVRCRCPDLGRPGPRRRAGAQAAPSVCGGVERGALPGAGTGLSGV